MIERKFIAQNIKEFQIKEFIKNSLARAGLSDVKLQRTPLGEKIIISASRPGLIVGRAGANINQLTKDLKRLFKLENPQIEIDEVTSPNLDASIVADEIVSSLERFGTARFKGIGHKAMSDVMNSGALGVEILISGRIPSSRAKRWRFYQGYLKKCGDISVSGVSYAYAVANIKAGSIGVQVSIMPPTTELPDKIEILKEPITTIEQLEDHEPHEPELAVEEETVEETTPTVKTTETTKAPSEPKKVKKSAKKTTAKKTTKSKPTTHTEKKTPEAKQ